MLNRTFIPLALLSLAFAADAAAQSAVPDTTPTIGPARPELFKRIIDNQKKGEAALDLYERIERVETRKNPNDPAPSSVKISRVIPSVFFSSRRRHTRLQGDWSSDVCSSD